MADRTAAKTGSTVRTCVGSWMLYQSTKYTAEEVLGRPPSKEFVSLLMLLAAELGLNLALLSKATALIPHLDLPQEGFKCTKRNCSQNSDR